MKAIKNTLYVFFIVCITHQIIGHELIALYYCEKPHTESNTSSKKCHYVNHAAEEEVHAALFNITGAFVLSANERVVPVNSAIPANLDYSIWLPPENSPLLS